MLDDLERRLLVLWEVEKVSQENNGTDAPEVDLRFEEVFPKGLNVRPDSFHPLRSMWVPCPQQVNEGGFVAIDPHGYLQPAIIGRRAFGVVMSYSEERSQALVMVIGEVEVPDEVFTVGDFVYLNAEGELTNESSGTPIGVAVLGNVVSLRDS